MRAPTRPSRPPCQSFTGLRVVSGRFDSHKEGASSRHRVDLAACERHRTTARDGMLAGTQALMPAVTASHSHVFVSSSWSKRRATCTSPCYPCSARGVNSGSLSPTVRPSRADSRTQGMHAKRGWDLWRELPSVESEGDFDCLVRARASLGSRVISTRETKYQGDPPLGLTAPASGPLRTCTMPQHLALAPIS